VDNGLPNTIDPTDSTRIQLNGFTVPLVAKVAVVPCATYHLKIAIADANDNAAISSVFLKAGSLKSNRQVYIDSVHYPIGLQAATEGCATARVAVALKPAQASPYTVHLQYGGSATKGTDYTAPDSLVILAGDTVGSITITALADGIAEGTEQISVQLISPCGLVYDSVLVPIQDYIPLLLSFKDTVKCPLDTVQLEASGATTYSWSPAFGLSTATIANPLCFATQTQAYICTGTIGTCTATDTVKVNMRALSLLLLQDSILCKGDSATLHVSERNNFQPLSYTCAGNSNATGIFRLPEGNYTIQAQSLKGCTVQDMVTITAPDSLKLQTLKVISPICFGDNTGSIEVTASGGTFPYNYNWNNTSVNTNSQNNLAAGNYSLTVTDAHACKTQNSYFLNSPIQVTVSVTPRDSTLENNNAVQLNSLVKPMPNAVQYLWTPALGLSCTDCPNPIAQPSSNTVYRLTVKYDNQCELSDSLYIQVKDNHLFYIPNAFSPNGDGRNEEWKLFTNSSLKYISVQVFNRWGEKVFESEDENKGWDGTYKGVPQLAGVYAYQYTICFLNGAVEKGKGSLTLVR
jgi:gliding motility-associated-like protein